MFEDVPNRRDDKLCFELKEKMCEMMRLTGRVTMRAHHTLCCFCGYGRTKYPDSLRPKIIEEMQRNPDLEIRVVAGLDDLCYSCPMCMNNRCVGADGKMFPADIKKDIDVLQRLRLISGAVLPARELFGTVAEKIPHVVDICGDNQVAEDGTLFTTCSPTDGHYEEALAQRFWE
jgi:hypothetical protein